MLIQFKKIYMKNVYDMLKEKLMKVAEEFNLDYDELERAYLQDIKNFIDDN